MNKLSNIHDIDEDFLFLLFSSYTHNPILYSIEPTNIIQLFLGHGESFIKYSKILTYTKLGLEWDLFEHIEYEILDFSGSQKTLEKYIPTVYDSVRVNYKNIDRLCIPQESNIEKLGISIKISTNRKNIKKYISKYLNKWESCKIQQMNLNITPVEQIDNTITLIEEKYNVARSNVIKISSHHNTSENINTAIIYLHFKYDLKIQYYDFNEGAITYEIMTNNDIIKKINKPRPKKIYIGDGKTWKDITLKPNLGNSSIEVLLGKAHQGWIKLSDLKLFNTSGNHNSYAHIFSSLVQNYDISTENVNNRKMMSRFSKVLKDIIIIDGRPFGTKNKKYFSNFQIDMGGSVQNASPYDETIKCDTNQ